MFKKQFTLYILIRIISLPIIKVIMIYCNILSIHISDIY